jgi:hypothetical protein
MLKFNTKCLILTFNAQGLRGIIIVVQVGIMKIYVGLVAMEPFKKKERQFEIQKTIKVNIEHHDASSFPRPNLQKLGGVSSSPTSGTPLSFLCSDQENKKCVR